MVPMVVISTASFLGASDGGTGAFVAVATRGGRLLLVDAKGEEILGSADMSGEVWLDGDR